MHVSPVQLMGPRGRTKGRIADLLTGPISCLSDAPLGRDDYHQLLSLCSGTHFDASALRQLYTTMARANGLYMDVISLRDSNDDHTRYGIARARMRESAFRWTCAGDSGCCACALTDALQLVALWVWKAGASVLGVCIRT